MRCRIAGWKLREISGAHIHRRAASRGFEVDLAAHRHGAGPLAVDFDLESAQVEGSEIAGRRLDEDARAHLRLADGDEKGAAHETKRGFPGPHRTNRFVAVAGETQTGDFDFGFARQLHEDAGKKHEIEPALGAGRDPGPGQKPFVRREVGFFSGESSFRRALVSQDRARDFALESGPAGGEGEERHGAKHARSRMEEGVAQLVFRALHFCGHNLLPAWRPILQGGG